MPSLGLLAFFASAVALSADSRIVTKTTLLGPNGGGRETIRTEYQQGDNNRSDSENWTGNSPARPVITIGLDRKVGYQLDPTAQQYIEYQLPPFPGKAGPPRAASEITADSSGKRLDIYFDVTDTGERKEVFGQTARHLIWRERRVAEPGACAVSSTRDTEVETDGWYLAEPERTGPQPVMIGSFSNGRIGKVCLDKIVVHGRKPEGLAVITTDGYFKIEVIEFSHEPLDKSVFEIPAGYTKVEELTKLQSPPSQTRPQTIEQELMQFLVKLESWFR